MYLRRKYRRVCSFILYIFIPVQLIILFGVHFVNRGDDGITRGVGAERHNHSPGNLRGESARDHRFAEDMRDMRILLKGFKQFKVDKHKRGRQKYDDVKSRHNFHVLHNERRLTNLHPFQKEGNHTRPLPKSVTPVLIDQTKAAIEQLKRSRDHVFSDAIGPPSDSQCILPDIEAPPHTCRDIVQWKCKMAPTFTKYNPVNRVITVDYPGVFRVNRVDRLEVENPVSRDIIRKRPLWEYYQGPANITMETEYADIVSKNEIFKDVHNYFIQFMPKPEVDWVQHHALRAAQLRDPSWKPVSVLTIVLDSTSRGHVHRSCGLPKTMALLKKYYDGFSSGRSHQSFLFNRLNSIGSATVLNLTPMFSGQLYEDVDDDQVRRGIYGKEIKEWMWQYAEARGYLTSYGIDNGSGMMGTRTHCKDCLYRPPVLPHDEHGWRQRENERVSPNVLSGLCDGNRLLHEYILDYTADFLRHPHPAKWAALDLNAGHRKEMESVNQVDDYLSKVLRTLLDEDKNLVVFLLGDHGKPFRAEPSHLGSHYETLLPFLSVTMPTWMLQERPDVFQNLAKNQERYLVHADLHLSMKSLLHFPNMEEVGGAKAEKAVNIFTEEISRERGCEDATIPAWSCVCGIMKKLQPSEWTDSQFDMAEAALTHINSLHSKTKLESVDSKRPLRPTSCIDLTFKKLLHVFINENTNGPFNSTSRAKYHLTFQTNELDTIWDLVIDEDLNIKQVKQVSLYQKFDVCWDKRVPLPYCVCYIAQRSMGDKLR